MFKGEPERKTERFKKIVEKKNLHYEIRKNDFVSFGIYPMEGELLVDPTGKMEGRYFPLGGGGGRGGGGGNNRNRQGGGNNRQGGGGRGGGLNTYEVDQFGRIKLPLIGYTRVEGYNKFELDSMLKSEYSKYYNKPFIQTQITGRFVYFFVGASGRTIPLVRENQNIFDILSQGGNLPDFSNVRNIRVIRGDLDDPSVYQIDLSTVQSVMESDIKILPGDIIYVRPPRRAWLTSIQEYQFLIGTTFQLITFSFLLLERTSN